MSFLFLQPPQVITLSVSFSVILEALFGSSATGLVQKTESEKTCTLAVCFQLAHQFIYDFSMNHFLCIFLKIDFGRAG